MNNEISIPHGNWKTSLTKYDFDKLSKFPFNFHGVIHPKKNDGDIDWQKLTSALAKFFTFKPTVADDSNLIVFNPCEVECYIVPFGSQDPCRFHGDCLPFHGIRTPHQKKL